MGLQVHGKFLKSVRSICSCSTNPSAIKGFIIVFFYMAGKLQAVDGVYKDKLKVLLLLVKFLPVTDVHTVAFSVVSSPMCYGSVLHTVS